jgi:hypothetical protein
VGDLVARHPAAAMRPEHLDHRLVQGHANKRY